MYHIPGITYGDVEEMPQWERQALFNLLLKQRKIEEEELKKAKGGAGAQGGGDLLQYPLPGTSFGMSDLEKQGPANRVARYIRGQQLKEQAAKEKAEKK